MHGDRIEPHITGAPNPIPAGGVKIDRAVGESIQWAHRNSYLCRPYIKKYAQELDDSVINEHIGLYVNTFSENLGDEGLSAIEFFFQKGRQAGILPEFHQQSLTMK